MTVRQRRRSVLITGAAGDIGTGFVNRHGDDYELTLLDLPGAVARANCDGHVVTADIRDLAALTEVFVGIDTVVHLAAHRQPSTAWADVLDTNIVGTYNVVAAAIASGCRRVVYASSVHTVSGYPRGRQVREDDPVNPGNLYGASKCFGEALGRYAAEQEGLSFIVLRIGAYQQPAALSGVPDNWTLDEYCAPDDLSDLLKLCVDDEEIRFEIFNAVSDNRFNRLDVSKARERLGYKPAYDAFAMVPALRKAMSRARLSTPTSLSGMRDDIGRDAPREGEESA